MNINDIIEAAANPKTPNGVSRILNEHRAQNIIYRAREIQEENRAFRRRFLRRKRENIEYCWAVKEGRVK